MNPLAQPQNLELASKQENIVVVEQLVDELKEQLNLPDELYGNVLIALTEAVNNAIVHGNALADNKKVAIAYEAASHAVIFTVKDEGEGFDFNHLPDPTDPSNLEKITGRGVFLMRQLSDEMEYSEGGACVRLLFKY